MQYMLEMCGYATCVPAQKRRRCARRPRPCLPVRVSVCLSVCDDRRWSCPGRRGGIHQGVGRRSIGPGPGAGAGRRRGTPSSPSSMHPSPGRCRAEAPTDRAVPPDHPHPHPHPHTHTRPTDRPPAPAPPRTTSARTPLVDCSTPPPPPPPSPALPSSQVACPRRCRRCATVRPVDSQP